MTTIIPATPRRIRIDVQLSGGRVRLDLTEPTDEQLQRVTGLLEEWLDDKPEPSPQPVPEPEAEPAPANVALAATVHICTEPGCPEPGPFSRAQALGAHRRYKHGTGPRGAVDTPGIEPTQGESEPPTPPSTGPSSGPATDRGVGPGVALCRCGHGERMHEKDEAVGRGSCFHSVCGCSEYRAAAAS